MKNKQVKNKKKNHVMIRVNVLFFAVFLLFSILILRLGVMQIVKGEEYEAIVNRTDVTSVSYSVPRGELYDRYQNLVVYNIPEKAITFTPPKNPQPANLLKLAKKLDQFITMPKEDKNKVTTRDLKDIWLLENDNGNELITDKENELFKKKLLTNDDIYQLKLDRITEDHLKTIDQNVAAIYRKLSTAIALTPTIVKNKDVTDEEYAIVSENLAHLPGIDITTDWQRGRTYDETFWNMLGTVSSADKGLPAEKVDYYRAKGYPLNERVGEKYIEELYDDVLHGKKAQVKTITDKNGNVVDTEVITEGQGGYDLVLTIDMDFQAEVEKIIQEELLNAIQLPGTDTLDTAFVVAMEPSTGEILAMSGKYYSRERNQFDDFTPGTFTAAYEPGSVVKGATILTGYQTGVLKPGEYIKDEIMKFAGSRPIKSHQVMGTINDLTALERSSNVYMWKVAIRMLGDEYTTYDQKLSMNEEGLEEIRYYFSQFGLGVPTGIGFTNETTGIKGWDPSAYYQMAIGQFDTYTTLQLAQYVSTIANDGYRMKPQLVKEIREPNLNSNELGNIVDTIEPVLLNKVDMKDDWIKRVQDGFWLVTHGSRGTARGYFKNEPYNAAAKTGTAQSYKNGKQTYNLSFVGYAPFDEPEIAIAVMVPNAYEVSYQGHSAANIISQRVFRAYFDLKDQRKSLEGNLEEAEGSNDHVNVPEGEISTDETAD